MIILGADPSKHAASFATQTMISMGARNLIAAGIAYAAGGVDASGEAATGAYICLSQYFYFTVRCHASVPMRSVFAVPAVLTVFGLRMHTMPHCQEPPPCHRCAFAKLSHCCAQPTQLSVGLRLSLCMPRNRCCGSYPRAPAQPPGTPVSLLSGFLTPGTMFAANPTQTHGPTCDEVTLGT